MPIAKQLLKTETLSIIALLNLQYWCEDEREKARLMAVPFSPFFSEQI